MKKTTFIEGLNSTPALQNKTIFIGLKGIAGHGGYSSGCIQIETKSSDITPLEDSIKIINLRYERRDSFSSKMESHSKLCIGVGESRLDTAFIDYEDILYLGVD